MDAISTAIDCNFKAPLMFMRLLIPQMAKQGGGLFINVTTGIEGHLSNQNMPGQASTSLLYPSTKAGLNWTTMLLAKEVREHNISVVGLQPGATLVERVTVSKEASMGYNLPAGTRCTCRASSSPTWQHRPTRCPTTARSSRPTTSP